MSSITKEKAWDIFRADKLGHEEGQQALVNMTDLEMDDYQTYEQIFEMKLAQIGVEAQNEAAAIMEANPELQYLTTKPLYSWTVADYTNVVKPFEGSKYEKLHLSAMFRVQNNELLLELVKP